MTIASRLAALEARCRWREPVPVAIIAATDCTSEEAVARHAAEHGPQPVRSDGRVSLIVLVPHHA